jgi:hypothetical protein
MNKSMLVAVLFAFVITVALTFIPIANKVLYPFKLFSTFVHEASHGLSAIITGGKWNSFVINVDTSGYALTQGGWRFIIIPAGYLGTSLIGGILLILSARKSHIARVILMITGSVLVLITLIFGKTTPTYLTGIGFGGVLFFIGFLTKGFFPAFVLNFLAVNLSLNALLDVKTLFFHTTGAYGANDAVSMNAQVLGLGNITWAVIFVLASVLITYGFLKKALKKGKEEESISTTY